MEAYDLLKAAKDGQESFSRVIKRRLRSEHTARALLTHLRSAALSEEALDIVEDVVRSRDQSFVSSPIVDLGE
jgi:predicted CopG family antitoxin